MEFIENYVKENNIKGYLCSNDIEKMKKYLLRRDYEELDKDIDMFNDIEDLMMNHISTYNYRLAVENEDIDQMINYIYGCEFDIEINKEGKIDLIDMQGAYLGGNYENFETIKEALGRLSGSYLYDYYGIEVC